MISDLLQNRSKMITKLQESEYLSVLKNMVTKPEKKEQEYLAENEEDLEEKWAKDVEIKSTGEHAGKSIAQLKAEIESLKGKPGNKEKMGELLFALRAKQGWKKKTGL